MYLEQILEEIKSSIKVLNLRIENLAASLSSSKNIQSEYLTIKQLVNSGFWPYSEHATRKMIDRKKLIEGIHYSKINGRIIMYLPALKNFLQENFYSHPQYQELRSA